MWRRCERIDLTSSRQVRLEIFDESKDLCQRSSFPLGLAGISLPEHHLAIIQAKILRKILIGYLRIPELITVDK